MQIIDQGLINTDPRFIVVPIDGVNMIPTDIRGLTFNRSPQQNINIVTIGAKDGKGGFPEGLLGKINTPEVRVGGSVVHQPCSKVLPFCCATPRLLLNEDDLTFLV
jgi:hypothetical protein